MKNINQKNIFSRLLLILLLSAVSISLQAATIWDLSAGSTTTTATSQGTRFGNELTFTEGMDILTATSWSERGRRERFRRGFLGQYDPGLGVCNRREGRRCPRNNSDQPVDNAGEREWVLLILDGFYSFENIVLDISNASDRNVSYWVGNVDPAIDLNRISYSDLPGLGFQAQVDAIVIAGTGSLAISSGAGQTNAILFGASRLGRTDALFINSLQASRVVTSVVPLPAGVWLFSSALFGVLAVGISGRKRRNVNN